MVEFLTHGKEVELLKHIHTRGQSDACMQNFFCFLFPPFLFPNAMLPGSLLMTKKSLYKERAKSCHLYWVHNVNKKKIYPIITCFLYAFVAIKTIICEDKAILSQPREKNRCVKGIGINVWSFLCNADY